MAVRISRWGSRETKVSRIWETLRRVLDVRGGFCGEARRTASESGMGSLSKYSPFVR
jgi:hypothetical protein